ncbi:hypothetical protein vseg_000230 [Gypsophila vaccaria]
MIKAQTLKPMAYILDKSLSRVLIHDPIHRKISTYNNNHNHNNINNRSNNFGKLGFSLRREDVIRVDKIRAFALSQQQPISEDKLSGGVNDVVFCDGTRSLPHKVVVAVDVDEVLGNFVSALNRFIADRYSSNHSVSEYHVYEFFKIWKCSRDEADIRVHEFFKTSYFKSGIHPIPGAQKVLNKLSKFCNLAVVTSRQNVIKDHTLEWIEKHYPGLFEEIHFGNHFALDGESRPKSEICRSMGAKVLIDDNPRYALECAEVGMRVLLFDYENSYPWCKTGSSCQHPLVTKVHNWEEVEQQLVSWIFSSHL